MAEQTEHREPLNTSAIRLRFALFRRYEDAAGSELAAGEHAAAIAAAWDVEPLLAEVDRLQATVDRLRALADGMAAESPKPGPGGFIAEGIYDALGADQPPPTTCGRPGCRESEGGYEGGSVSVDLIAEVLDQHHVTTDWFRRRAGWCWWCSCLTDGEEVHPDGNGARRAGAEHQAAVVVEALAHGAPVASGLRGESDA